MVFTFFWRFPFPKPSLFSPKRKGSRNGINSTEKNFIWSLHMWSVWGNPLLRRSKDLEVTDLWNLAML